MRALPRVLPPSIRHHVLPMSPRSGSPHSAPSISDVTLQEEGRAEPPERVDPDAKGEKTEALTWEVVNHSAWHHVVFISTVCSANFWRYDLPSWRDPTLRRRVLTSMRLLFVPTLQQAQVGASIIPVQLIGEWLGTDVKGEWAWCELLRPHWQLPTASRGLVHSIACTDRPSIVRAHFGSLRAHKWRPWGSIVSRDRLSLANRLPAPLAEIGRAHV